MPFAPNYTIAHLRENSREFAVVRCKKRTPVVFLDRSCITHTSKTNHNAKRGFFLAQQANILSFDKAKRSTSVNAQKAVRAQKGVPQNSYNSKSYAGSRFAQKDSRLSSDALSYSPLKSSSSRSLESLYSGGFPSKDRYSGSFDSGNFRSGSLSSGNLNSGNLSSSSVNPGSVKRTTHPNAPSYTTGAPHFDFASIAWDSEPWKSREEDTAPQASRTSRTSSTSQASHASRSSQHPRPGIMSYDDFLREEDAETNEEGEESAAPNKTRKASFSQKLASLKRKRTKEKASKAFAAQFGNAQNATNAGPRAAVYKGEMGRVQRHAQRLQSNATAAHYGKHAATHLPASSYSAGVAAGFAGTAGHFAGAASYNSNKTEHASSASERTTSAAGNALSAVGGVFARIAQTLFGTSRRVAALSVAACLVIACTFMYPAAKQYYQEMRYLDQVQAEYDAVVERNTELASTRDYLQSNAGVEEMAHDKYGWVNEGENSVLVYGLPEDDTIADTNLSIKRGSVEAPETWYSVILDPLFGVE